MCGKHLKINTIIESLIISYSTKYDHYLRYFPKYLNNHQFSIPKTLPLSCINIVYFWQSDMIYLNFFQKKTENFHLGFHSLL